MIISQLESLVINSLLFWWSNRSKTLSVIRTQLFGDQINSDPRRIVYWLETIEFRSCIGWQSIQCGTNRIHGNHAPQGSFVHSILLRRSSMLFSRRLQPLLVSSRSWCLMASIASVFDDICWSSPWRLPWWLCSPLLFWKVYVFDSSECTRWASMLLENSWYVFSRFNRFSHAIQRRHISLRCHRSCSTRSPSSLRRPTVSGRWTAHSHHWLLFSNHPIHGTQALEISGYSRVFFVVKKKDLSLCI